MRLYIIILLNGLVLGQLMAQEKKYIRQGNSSYESQDFENSELKYRKALEKNVTSFDAGFNLGDALFKQKKYEEAAKKFEELAHSEAGKEDKAKAFHNLGNTMMQTQKLEEGVEAYKNALRNNPKDEETRYNLAYAQKMLKQQQEQQKQDNKDQEKKDDQNKDQKDQDKKDQDKKDQEKKDQEKKDEQKDKQDQNKDQQDKQDQQDQKKQEQKAQQIPKEKAEQMLKALENDEKDLQKKMKMQMVKGQKVKVEKDW